MYGAILGDIIGSPFEFDRGDKTKEFPLFSDAYVFTDDSVMTIAVADALLQAGPEADDTTTCELLIKSMKKWGQKYPNAGYGARFYHWVLSDDPKPYGSYGNGSAMRVSAAGWLYGTLEKTLEVAEWTAKVTHNHPEGIKGARATAGIIFLARNGATKEEIRRFAVEEIGYDLSRSCDEIRPDYQHDESCQRTVPEAITAFLESESYEDAVRTAVSLGGDTDTLACICGAMAEAFYGVPVHLEAECRERVTKEMREVLKTFDFAKGRDLHESTGITAMVSTMQGFRLLWQHIWYDD